METNNNFSFRRFWLLCQQSLIINKRMIGLSIISYSGILFAMLLLFQAGGHFRQWDFGSYFFTFIFTFILLGIGFSSTAFPAFRSKEKCMFYLMLPSSATEKYLLEFLVHIAGFVIVMPILFLLVAYLESHMVHMFNSGFDQFSFSANYFKVKFHISSEDSNIGLSIIAAVEYVIFLFLVFFTGASHFSKSPLSKTILTVIIISTGFSIYSSFLTYVMELGEKPKALFINNMIHNGFGIVVLIISIMNLSLLAIAWFKLKEKEV